MQGKEKYRGFSGFREQVGIGKESDGGKEAGLECGRNL